MPTGVTIPCLHDADHLDVARHVEQGQFFWLDLEDPSEERLQQLAEKLKLHPLTVDDARVFRERPKIEEFDTYVYLVLYGVDPATEAGSRSKFGSPMLREVHMIVSGDYVVTIHRRPFGALEELRTRTLKTPMRTEQHMIYKVIDAVLMTFIPVLQNVDDDVDEIEDSIVGEDASHDPQPDVLKRIYQRKRDLVAMRRVVLPMRDVFARDAERITDLPGLEPDDTPYFRDLYDSLIRVSDLVDAYRDLLSGATDLYLSTVANRQGEVGKQLAIVATIFLPLSFLTGFFGQNFSWLGDHILDNAWTFFVLGIGLCVASAAGMWVWFKRKRWV